MWLLPAIPHSHFLNKLTASTQWTLVQLYLVCSWNFRKRGFICPPGRSLTTACWLKSDSVWVWEPFGQKVEGSRSVFEKDWPIWKPWLWCLFKWSMPGIPLLGSDYKLWFCCSFYLSPVIPVILGCWNENWLSLLCSPSWWACGR